MTSIFQLDQINPLRGLRESGLIVLQERAMLGYCARLDEKELSERTGMKLELVGRNGGQYA